MGLDFFPILLKTFQIQFEVRNINQGVADWCHDYHERWDLVKQLIGVQHGIGAGSEVSLQSFQGHLCIHMWNFWWLLFFGKCPFHQSKTLCRNQLKLSALFTRDEILEYKPLQTLLKKLGPVLYSSVRFMSGFPSLVNILSGVLSNPIKKKNNSSLLAWALESTEYGNVGIKKLRVWSESMRGVATQKYQIPIYQMVSEVEKGGKNREKYSPVGLSWRPHAAAKKKIAKFQKVSAEFVLFLPIEMWIHVHGQGMYTYIGAGVMPVFSIFLLIREVKVWKQTKTKPNSNICLIDKNSTYSSKKLFCNLLFVCS